MLRTTAEKEERSAYFQSWKGRGGVVEPVKLILLSLFRKVQGTPAPGWGGGKIIHVDTGGEGGLNP